MTEETKKIRDEMIAEAWMHASLKTSEFSSNLEQQDRKIFTLGFDAGYSARDAQHDIWDIGKANTARLYAENAYAALKAEAFKVARHHVIGFKGNVEILFTIDEALTAWREKYGEKK